MHHLEPISDQAQTEGGEVDALDAALQRLPRMLRDRLRRFFLHLEELLSAGRE
jgi:hypothetical protein